MQFQEECMDVLALDAAFRDFGALRAIYARLWYITSITLLESRPSCLI